MKHTFFISSQRGQTLVLLLMFMVIAIMVASASVMIIVVNSRATDRTYQGTTALDIAESGAETAMIKLLRDPGYTGETVQVNGGYAQVSVASASGQLTVTSIGIINNFSRSVRATVDYTNNIMTVTSWQEL